jgi:hypothetical protein
MPQAPVVKTESKPLGVRGLCTLPGMGTLPQYTGIRWVLGLVLRLLVGLGTLTRITKPTVLAHLWRGLVVL